MEWKASEATQYGRDLEDDLLALLHRRLYHDSCPDAVEQHLSITFVWIRNQGRPYSNVGLGLGRRLAQADYRDRVGWFIRLTSSRSVSAVYHAVQSLLFHGS